MLNANAANSYNFVLIKQGTLRYKLLINTVVIELLHLLYLINFIQCQSIKQHLTNAICTVYRLVLMKKYILCNRNTFANIV